MNVPVFRLNRLAHCLSRQRYGIVLCFAPAGTFCDPQYGHAMPFGQRYSISHASAAASSGNSRMILDQ